MNVPETVVVSPHLDDAVFSCWHVIADRDHDVSVVTVFTAARPGIQSSWDACTDPIVDSAIRAQERKDEDRKALAVAGRTPIHLPLYNSRFGAIDPGEIVECLAPHIDKVDTVYAPLAIGHDEHVLVRDAVCEIHATPVFYVEYPYALIFPVEPQRPRDGLLDGYVTEERILRRNEIREKLTACRQYAGELVRLRECTAYGNFVKRRQLRREVIFRPPASGMSWTS